MAGMGIMVEICTSPYPSPSPSPIKKVGESPYPYPYPIEKVGESPYPYPVNAGILRQNGDGFGQYP